MTLTLVKPTWNAAKEITLLDSDEPTLVDACHYDYFMQWEWQKIIQPNGFLVVRYYKSRCIFLHREVFGLHQDNFRCVRHVNGNTLDNRYDNLAAVKDTPKSKRNYAPVEFKLTPKQREVALLALRGLNRKEIAGHMYLGLSTIDTHLYGIYNAIGVESFTEMVAILMRSPHLLDLPSFEPEIKPITSELHCLKSQRLKTAMLLIDAVETARVHIGRLYAIASEFEQVARELEGILEVMQP